MRTYTRHATFAVNVAPDGPVGVERDGLGVPDAVPRHRSRRYNTGYSASDTTVGQTVPVTPLTMLARTNHTVWGLRNVGERAANQLTVHLHGMDLTP